MEVKGSRYITPRFENPDKETLIPLFEYFPVLFGPEKIKAHRKYTEYIVYDKIDRTFCVYEPIDSIQLGEFKNLSSICVSFDIPINQCSEIKSILYAPNLLCRN